MKNASHGQCIQLTLKLKHKYVIYWAWGPHRKKCVVSSCTQDSGGTVFFYLQTDQGQ